jgi:hypothetical protein
MTAWSVLWRIAASVALVMACWAVLMLLAQLTGRTLDGAVLLSYLIAGALLPLGVWILVLIWRPYLDPPRRPGMSE